MPIRQYLVFLLFGIAECILLVTGPLDQRLAKILAGQNTASCWLPLGEGWTQEKLKGRLLIMAGGGEHALLKAVRAAAWEMEEQGEAIPSPSNS